GVAMPARGHGRLDRVVLIARGGANLKRARRTVPPDSSLFLRSTNQLTTLYHGNLTPSFHNLFTK
ncbi:MAG: hypothetical protein WEB60_08575, partial [Terrimicrobiaceae bacterium]